MVHFFSTAPRAELLPFVEAIWGVRGSAHYQVEGVVPNGAIELMINFGPTQRVVAYGERSANDPFQRAWLAGIQQRRLVHASPLGCDHIAVRFRPGGAHAFFRFPMNAVAGQVIELEDLIGAAASSLRDQLGEAQTDEARVALLEQWLLRRRLAVHSYFPTVRSALSYLKCGAHRLRVADLCERLGVSNKHLVHQFQHIVGLSPKTFARIGRFQAVIDAARGRSRVNWSVLGYQLGYADQSHLIREFRDFAGVHPTEFLRKRTPDESHVVIA